MTYIEFLTSGALDSIDYIFAFAVKLLVEVESLYFSEGEEFGAGFALLVVTFWCSFCYGDAIGGLNGGILEGELVLL